MYHLNGGGRDTYIHTNNGGFSIPKTNGNPTQPSTKMFPDVRCRKQVSPKGASAVDTQRPMYYKVNGGGRDTYIGFNNGGFTTQ